MSDIRTLSSSMVEFRISSRSRKFPFVIDSLIVKYGRVNHMTMYLLNRKGEVGRITTLSSKATGVPRFSNVMEVPV